MLRRRGSTQGFERSGQRWWRVHDSGCSSSQVRAAVSKRWRSLYKTYTHSSSLDFVSSKPPNTYRWFACMALQCPVRGFGACGAVTCVHRLVGTSKHHMSARKEFHSDLPPKIHIFLFVPSTAATCLRLPIGSSSSAFSPSKRGLVSGVRSRHRSSDTSNANKSDSDSYDSAIPPNTTSCRFPDSGTASPVNHDTVFGASRTGTIVCPHLVSGPRSGVVGCGSLCHVGACRMPDRMYVSDASAPPADCPPNTSMQRLAGLASTSSAVCPNTGDGASPAGCTSVHAPSSTRYSHRSLSTGSFVASASSPSPPNMTTRPSACTIVSVCPLRGRGRGRHGSRREPPPPPAAAAAAASAASLLSSQRCATVRAPETASTSERTRRVRHEASCGSRFTRGEAAAAAEEAAEGKAASKAVTPRPEASEREASEAEMRRSTSRRRSCRPVVDSRGCGGSSPSAGREKVADDINKGGGERKCMRVASFSVVREKMEERSAFACVGCLLLFFFLSFVCRVWFLIFFVRGGVCVCCVFYLR
eukprot:Rhum_TRINITY_DN14889_c26_g1::Rhum_TRINITY_DN14889_c26_g1_i1::g.126507::m.126507